MEKRIIVGASFAGIVAARLMKKNQQSFVALEKSKRLGGSSVVGHHRFYQDGSVGFLRALSEETAWEREEESSQERKKNNWTPVAVEDADDAEKFYLGAPYYHTAHNFNDFISTIKAPVEENFLFEKFVEKIDVFNHRITCQDGSKYEYESLIWCADLNALLKSVENNPAPDMKGTKKISDPPAGINLEMELKQPLTAFKNSVVFPFRFKEYRLKAIGNSEPGPAPVEGKENTITMHWMVMVERELAEDREEVAKVIRALKRELDKEFPELKELLLKEKIVFKQAVSQGSSAEVKGLEIFPDIYYLGPQVRLRDSLETLADLDLTVENCRRFEETVLASAGPDQPTQS